MAKLENKKILIVEDDRLISSMLVKKFTDEKAIVAQAIDGESALAMIASNTFDLILLDLILPKVGGYDVLSSIRSNEKTKDLKVIILSNVGQKADVEKGLRLGAKKFLVKALFSTDEIVDASVEVLNQN
jgi:DNA-binding response OmpR family regulator